MRATLEERGWLVEGCDLKRRSVYERDCREVFKYDTVAHYDLVVHAAAVVGGRQTIDGAPLDVAVNFELDAAYLRWVRETKPRYAIYLSSSAVYPVAAQQAYVYPPRRLTETDVRVDMRAIEQPDQTYGWTKFVGELQAEKLRELGQKVLIARPFSGYGADQDVTYPFPAFVERARNKDDPFVVWGNPFQERDFIHVDDVINALLAAHDEDVDGVLNVCTGT